MKKIDFTPLSGIDRDRAFLACGLIPQFLNPSDDRPAKDQLHTAYAHGGGWRPFEGFTLDPETLLLSYPGDPDTRPFGRIDFGDEAVIVYEHSWVVILQTDGSYEVARMD